MRIKEGLRKLFSNCVRVLLDSNAVYRKRLDRISSIDQQTQILLALKYKELQHRGVSLPSFSEVEFRSFSQNGEDGILHYIFSLIGTTDKRAVEICAGDGIECNTANLIINHGWYGLLVDGNCSQVEKGREFYANYQDTFIWPPAFVEAWVTTENVNALLTEQGFSGEIDLLSLDMDGVDYWIWKGITGICPRVVVVEYQDGWGPEKSVTVEYQANFQSAIIGSAGASLAAFVKLGKEKGYRLVGCQRYGFNAFFIRNDIAQEIFPEVTSATCFNHPRALRQIEWDKLNAHKWVEV